MRIWGGGSGIGVDGSGSMGEGPGVRSEGLEVRLECGTKGLAPSRRRAVLEGMAVVGTRAQGWGWVSGAGLRVSG